MERHEAIRALLRAGKRDEVEARIQSWSGTAASRFDQIRADGSRTDEYKRWELAVAATQCLRSLTSELIDMASRVAATDQSDAERVFGVKGLDGDPASLIISRRDAGDRVAAISDREELRELLDRATRSGDEVLARAVAERAVRMKDAKTLNQFSAARPDLEAAADRLWGAEHADSNTMRTTMLISGFKPAELSSVSLAGMESVASQPPAGV